jgi:hypothetical protein
VILTINTLLCSIVIPLIILMILTMSTNSTNWGPIANPSIIILLMWDDTAVGMTRKTGLTQSNYGDWRKKSKKCLFWIADANAQSSEYSLDLVIDIWKTHHNWRGWFGKRLKSEFMLSELTWIKVSQISSPGCWADSSVWTENPWDCHRPSHTDMMWAIPTSPV